MTSLGEMYQDFSIEFFTRNNAVQIVGVNDKTSCTNERLSHDWTGSLINFGIFVML